MTAPVGVAGPRLGRVASFDPARGLGTVTDDDGAVYPFHATAIADGTRRIDVGARVSYVLAPGHGGRHEARRLLARVTGAQEPAEPPTAPHQRPS